MENRQPFFIIASPRSGTTLLERLLNRHSRIFIPPETAFFFHLQCKGYTEKDFSPDRASSYLDYYLKTRPARLLQLDQPGIKERLLEGVRGYADLFGNLMNLLAEGCGKDIIGEKTPHHLHCITFIKKLYPLSPIVAMIRDGRAVVDSRLRHPNWEKNLLSASWHWRDDARRLRHLIAQDSEDRVILVRYEKLVRDPDGEVRKVLHHLGVEYEEGLHKRKMEIRGRFASYYSQEWMKKSTTMPDPVRIDAWRNAFSEDELKTVEGEIREELQYFGYEPVFRGGKGPFRILARELLRHGMYRLNRGVRRRVGMENRTAARA